MNNKKVYLVVCFVDVVDFKTQTSITKAGWHAVKNHIDVEIRHHIGSFLSRQRTDSAKDFLLTECDYLMFVDADVIIPEDAITKLVNLDKDVSGIIYYARRDPQFNPICYMNDVVDTKIHLKGYRY